MQKKFLVKIPYIITKSTIKVLTIIIALVLFVVMAVFIYCLRMHKIDDLASIGLAKAYAAFASANQQAGIAILDEVIAKYPKASAAYQAKLSRADVLTELKAYDEALNILKEIQNGAEPEPLKPLAAVRIIYVYDAKKDIFNTITASEEFINKYPDHFLVRDIYLNLAEYYLASGSKENALKIFNEILISFPATQEAEKAQRRINEIK
ncbi:MAG: tetratricopeptide repeat protein [Endomicrobium sp.]|jgi:outer membrane protein assembly factor BamD (BamD/ComL family)|nr:tetratricopeptide repeat protein [Endomicrobium sp.]